MLTAFRVPSRGDRMRPVMVLDCADADTLTDFWIG
jgi:hypothetical protein